MQALLETGFDGSHAKEKAEEMLSYFSPAGKLVGYLPQHLFRRGTVAAESGTHHGQKAAADAAGRTDSFAGQQIKVLVKDMLLKLKQEDTSMIGIFHDLEFMDGLCGCLKKNPCSISE